MRAVRIGCSGWVYKDWRGAFYPEKLAQKNWLSHYAEKFDTVEVNNTFYRLPSEAAVKSWVAETPDGFGFTIKGSRYTTHIKRLIDPAKYTEKFFASIDPIVQAGKLATVLWQLPPTFKADHERLATMLSVCAERGGRHSFEFRHESWFCDETYTLLREHDAALVIAHDLRAKHEQPRELTASFAYVRFHFGEEGTGGSYSPSELDAWAKRISAWRKKAEVLAYFNNDWEAIAPKNADLLRSLVI